MHPVTAIPVYGLPHYHLQDKTYFETSVTY